MFICNFKFCALRTDAENLGAFVAKFADINIILIKLYHSVNQEHKLVYADVAFADVSLDDVARGWCGPLVV